MTITTLPQSLDVVQAEIARVEAQQSTWTEKRQQLAEELAGYQASVASALLDGASPAKIASEGSQLQGQLRDADTVLATLEEQRRGQARALQVGQLADERRAYRALREEIAARLARQLELVAPLLAFEGIEGEVVVPQIRGVTAGLEWRLDVLRRGITYHALDLGLSPDVDADADAEQEQQ